MMRRAVLIDDFDKRLGTVDVSTSINAVKCGDGLFVRTGEAVKLRPSHRATADVFRHTEVFVRDRLDPA